MRSINLIITSGILALGMNAFAGNHCKEDIAKHCKDVQPGQGRVIKCLKDNESKLSESCREHAKTMKEEMKGMHAEMKEQMKAHMEQVHIACKGDVEKLCKDVAHGEGRVHQCLKANETELSAECKTNLTEMKEKRKELRKEMREKRKEAKKTT